jgi:hypothetical protein
LGLEVKAGARAHPAQASPLVELLGTTRLPGLARGARRLGLVVTRGREVEQVAPRVWAIPDWRLFGPAG